MTQTMQLDKGKTMKRRIVVLAIIGALYGVILLGILLVQRSKSETGDAGAVIAANQLIAAGNYAEATQIYEQLIAQGVNDSTVFYNLGNAYYGLGDTGRAVLNYQRALQLAPRDGDIRANLALARNQAQDPFENTAPGPLAIVASLTGAWLNLDETALIMLGLWFLTGILLLVWRQMTVSKRRHLVGMIAAVMFLFTMIGGLSLGSRLLTTYTQPEGVIVAKTVAVSDEPGGDSATGLALPGGTTVNLTEVRGDWAHLTTSGNAQKGWVPLHAVETVASLPTAT